MTYKKHSFHTYTRERQFASPSTTSHDIPLLNEFVTPFIESFNALFDDSGLPHGDGDGRGLLNLAAADLGERVVFDGKGSSNDATTRGNRLSCTSFSSQSGIELFIVLH